MQGRREWPRPSRPQWRILEKIYRRRQRPPGPASLLLEMSWVPGQIEGALKLPSISNGSPLSVATMPYREREACSV